MFTLEAIALAHAQVISGADFPKYIQDLLQLGVLSYNTYVTDGRTCYSGAHGFELSSEAKYAPIPIAQESKVELFSTYLKMHQNGETDYPTFCNHAAECGVERWQVNLGKLSCTYFDTNGAIVLEEAISA
ncbi:MAG: DUF1398 domain-containing protein [Sphingobacteriaceae bacterium]